MTEVSWRTLLRGALLGTGQHFTVSWASGSATVVADAVRITRV